MNSGGSGGDIPIEPDTNDIIMVDENNYVLTFEDGSIMCFSIEEIEANATELLTFEDGSLMCFNVELTNDIILINELEEILINENNNILIE